MVVLVLHINMPCLHSYYHVLADSDMLIYYLVYKVNLYRQQRCPVPQMSEDIVTHRVFYSMSLLLGNAAYYGHDLASCPPEDEGRGRSCPQDRGLAAL